MNQNQGDNLYDIFLVDRDGNVLNVPEGASTLTIEPIDGGYSIMVNNGDNDGKYIYGSSGSNKTNFGSTASAASLEYTDTVISPSPHQSKRQ